MLLVTPQLSGSCHWVLSGFENKIRNILDRLREKDVAKKKNVGVPGFNSIHNLC
jgi:hypothetical protein